MSALLEFECRVPVDGYRIMTSTERKFVDVTGPNWMSGDFS